MSSKNRLIKNNYHTHMYLCRHASGTVEDYVLEAIDKGFDSIGFSEHAPWDELINRSERMYKSDYPLYLRQLHEVREEYRRRIDVFIGLEVEFFQNRTSFYEKYQKELDYMILGQHYLEIDNNLYSAFHINNVEEMQIYKETVIEAMETNYFRIIAHPDLFLFHQKELTQEMLDIAEEIVLAAKKNNVLLEVNANGIRKGIITVNDEVLYRYPRKEFFQLAAKHNAQCIISSDAHQVELLYDEAIENSVKFSKRLGLKVVEALPL